MSKFKVGDHVRPITPGVHFDKIGRVFGINAGLKFPVDVAFNDGEQMPYQEAELTLADPDVHTVLDQMDAESTDPVSSPSHYRSHPSGIETITITRHESFLRGNVLKYVLRAPYKGSEIEDLKKAAQYLQWEIDRAEAAQ